MTTHPPNREIARAVRSISVALMIIAAALFVLLTWLLLFRIPHYAEIFADFDTELPALTQLAISSHPWSGFAAITLAVLAIAKELVVPPNPAVILNGALIALALGLVVVYEISIQLPWYAMFNMVTGGP